MSRRCSCASGRAPLQAEEEKEKAGEGEKEKAGEGEKEKAGEGEKRRQGRRRRSTNWAGPASASG